MKCLPLRIVAALVLATALPASAATLSATKTVEPIDLQWWGVKYTIVITNTGATAQPDNPGDEFFDYLVPTFTNVGAVVLSGGGTVTFDRPSGRLAWNGSIAAGASVTLQITAMLRSGAIGTVSNQGYACYDANDDGNNDTCTPTDDPSLPGTADPTTFTIPRTVDAMIAKEQLTPDPVVAGSGSGNLRYRVTLTASPLNARAVQFAVTERPTTSIGTPLPGVTLDSVSTANGTWDPATKVWLTNVLNPGTMATMDVTFTVGPNAPAGPNVIWNAAEVTGAVGANLARSGVMAVVRTSVVAPDTASSSVPLFDRRVLALLALALAAAAVRVLR